ncbi:MAG: hypothetical protein DRJ11_06500 [Candidatus Aminicenantes bacterium]|nr:MAG: hypothetical protein DRJ11_06500 [Candidatus Aminicenantes bacterium]
MTAVSNKDKLRENMFLSFSPEVFLKLSNFLESFFFFNKNFPGLIILKSKFSLFIRANYLSKQLNFFRNFFSPVVDFQENC